MNKFKQGDKLLLKLREGIFVACQIENISTLQNATYIKILKVLRNKNPKYNISINTGSGYNIGSSYVEKNGIKLAPNSIDTLEVLYGGSEA